jgi:hypothetical protein
MKRQRVIEYASMDHRERPAAALRGLADKVGLPIEAVVELAQKDELRCLFNPATRRLERPEELRRRYADGTLTAATPTPRDVYELRREVRRKRLPRAAQAARRRAQLAAKRLPPWQVDAENLGSRPGVRG